MKLISKQINLFIIAFVAFGFNSIGQTFQTLQGGVNLPVYCLFGDSIEDDLYVGGDFTLAGGMQSHLVAKWHLNSWDSLRNNLGGSPRAMLQYNNVLLAGGGFSKYNDTTGNYNVLGTLIRYDESLNNWFEYLPQPNSYVSGLRQFNSNLYIVGEFDSIANIPTFRIARWDGSSITPYPSIGNPSGANIMDCFEYNNELYVGGNFNFQTFNGLNDIAKWNGNQWVSLSGGLSGFNTVVNVFELYQSKLVIGGLFYSNNGDPGNNVVLWDGFYWYQLGSGVNGMVWSIKEFNGELWVGGTFSDAGGVAVSNLAIWDGSQWKHPGIDLTNGVLAIEELNGELYFGGSFYAFLNSGDTAKRIVKYNPMTGYHLLEDIEQSFRIFPNPNTGSFIIEFSEAILSETKLEIINYFGQSVYSEFIDGGSKSLNIIIKKKLPNGIYVCRLSRGSDISIEKLIINNSLK